MFANEIVNNSGEHLDEETWPITDAEMREIFSISVIVEEKRGFHGSLQYYQKTTLR
uniref:Uncharacterized protein n=1 Tax=Solanum tuberosum TaxID=4113 RepID=M1DBV5_SOLTU